VKDVELYGERGRTPRAMIGAMYTCVSLHGFKTTSVQADHGISTFPTPAQCRRSANELTGMRRIGSAPSACAHPPGGHKPFGGMSRAAMLRTGASCVTEPDAAAKRRATDRFVGLSAEEAPVGADLTTIDHAAASKLARALATQPRLFLFDEVDAGLKPGESIRRSLIGKLVEPGINLVLVASVRAHSWRSRGGKACLDPAEDRRRHAAATSSRTLK